MVLLPLSRQRHLGVQNVGLEISHDLDGWLSTFDRLEQIEHGPSLLFADSSRRL